MFFLISLFLISEIYATIELTSSDQSHSGEKLENHYFNFVAGDELTCQAQITKFLENEMKDSSLVVIYTPKCKIGGSCGPECGEPNGKDCISANPEAFGACLSQKSVQNTLKHSRQLMTNL